MKEESINHMKTVYNILLSFTVALFALFPVSARCDYQIDLIASSITNPELGHFNANYASPVIEGDYVVFRTLNNLSAIAYIWSWNKNTKQFTKLVDLNTPAPDGTGNFTDLGAGMGGLILRDGIVVFGARDSAVPAPPAVATGIYSVPVTGGAIQRIANYLTPVPGGIGNFFNFSATSAPTGNFSYYDGVVGFEGDFGGGPIGNSGIYQSDIAGGNKAPIADSLHGIGTLFPNTNFTHVDVFGQRAAFIGGNVFGYNSLYSTLLPASLPNYHQLITVNTVLPGGDAGFSFVIPSVRVFDDKVFFIALDGTGGANNNRRTLYEIPFTGGTPIKILSNFDTLPGLATIEQSSVSSYDINQNHLLIRAKEPGSTSKQGLYLFDRSSRQFDRILNLDQEILGRSFGLLAEVQPGAFTADSSSAVASIAGSALFVGPYTYLVLLSSESSDDGNGSDGIMDPVIEFFHQIESALPSAKKPLPSTPDKSASKKKKLLIKAKRAAIKNARKVISTSLTSLLDMKPSSEQIESLYPNFSTSSLKKLKKLSKAGGSVKSTKTVAKKSWKMFTKLLGKVAQHS